MTASSEQPAAPTPPAKPRRRLFRRRRWPGPLVCVLVALCAGGIALFRARVLGARLEQAEVNVVTWTLGFAAVMTLVVWFVLFSAYGRRLRYTSVVVLGLGVWVLSSTLRVEHVSGDMVPKFVLRWRPEADKLLDKPVAQAAGIDLQTTTERDFPQFLGPHRNARLTGVNLARDWESRAPRLVWRVPIGAGWSSFAVVNGFAVTMEQRGEEEMVTCYEVATGQMKWFHSVRARHQTMLGGVGPRATPTIHQGQVYALGATGVLRRLDGANGREIWRDDLLQRIGVTPDEDLRAIAWGRANSPLIVDRFVVVPLGGPVAGPYASLAALDKDTGQLVWTGGQHQASYSSPCLATIDGQRQILIVNQDYVSGHQPETGAMLWEHPWPGKSNANASASQVVPLPDDRVLLSKGYHGGAKLLHVTRDSEGPWRISVVWENDRVLRTKFSNVVVHEGCAYGISDSVLECVDLATGSRQWKEGRYGQGQILGVDDLLLVQAESGEVALVEATPEEHRELGRFPAIEGKTWNNPSLYGHFLLVRNAEEAACYELP